MPSFAVLATTGFAWGAGWGLLAVFPIFSVALVVIVIALRSPLPPPGQIKIWPGGRKGLPVMTPLNNADINKPITSGDSGGLTDSKNINQISL